MLRHKNINRVCAVVTAVMLLLAAGYTALAVNGLVKLKAANTGYETRLFDQSKVHTVDIVIDNWDKFLETCPDEQYALCSLVIDGEKFSTVAIRGKGNTSLSSVAAYGNNRYSFKLEFDHYQSGKSYHGLDKLCLNNIIQDATYMKDYLAYTLMNKMGVPAPLCSFVKVNVNGEYWGLYLAVEAVEDAFLTRNYGGETGDLYKPDSMTMGGGKGNGGGFRMSEFQQKFENGEFDDLPAPPSGDFQPPEGFTPPEGFDPSQFGGSAGEGSEEGTDENSGEAKESRRSRGPGGFGGMGSSDVKLQYTDDDIDSYASIFQNAKTDANDADKARLIASLKALNEGADIESTVDVEEVIRYLVVHSFLVNGDSYTGSMIHNYYLYEQDGQLSMIPWDYNLSLGGFSMGFGGSADGATSAVNDPIDTPVSGGDVSSRPMVAWIFASDQYTERYHEVYREFMAEIYENGWLQEEIARVRDMIAPYVETDPTAFYTYEEFGKGVETLSAFMELRCQSVMGQLDGTIPATQDGQSADGSALIDASAITISDMGSMGGGGPGGGMPGFPGSGGDSDSGGEPSFGSVPSFGNMPGAGDSDSGDANSFPGAPPAMGADSAGSAETGDPLMEALPWLIASAVALIAGLVFAKRSRICR